MEARLLLLSIGEIICNYFNGRELEKHDAGKSFCLIPALLSLFIIGSSDRLKGKTDEWTGLNHL